MSNEQTHSEEIYGFQPSEADLASMFQAERAADKAECSACIKYAANPGSPTHDGSSGCRCGSIASGGKRAHCSCDTCF